MLLLLALHQRLCAPRMQLHWSIKPLRQWQEHARSGDCKPCGDCLQTMLMPACSLPAQQITHKDSLGALAQSARPPAHCCLFDNHEMLHACIVVMTDPKCLPQIEVQFRLQDASGNESHLRVLRQLQAKKLTIQVMLPHSAQWQAVSQVHLHCASITRKFGSSWHTMMLSSWTFRCRLRWLM